MNKGFILIYDFIKGDVCLDVLIAWHLLNEANTLFLSFYIMDTELILLFTEWCFVLAVLHKTASVSHDKHEKGEMRKPQTILSRLNIYLQCSHAGDLSCIPCQVLLHCNVVCSTHRTVVKCREIKSDVLLIIGKFFLEWPFYCNNIKWRNRTRQCIMYDF